MITGNDTYYLGDGVSLDVFCSSMIESRTTKGRTVFNTIVWVGLENNVLILDGVSFIEGSLSYTSSEIALKDAKSKLETLIKDNKELLLEYFKNDSN